MVYFRVCDKGMWESWGSGGVLLLPHSREVGHAKTRVDLN